MSNLEIYDERYFSEEIFECDYQIMADSIFELFAQRPSWTLDVGQGKLSLELARLGVRVTAIDGFFEARIRKSADQFSGVDLNNPGRHSDLLAHNVLTWRFVWKSRNTLIQGLRSHSSKAHGGCPCVVFSAEFRTKEVTTY